MSLKLEPARKREQKITSTNEMMSSVFMIEFVALTFTVEMAARVWDCPSLCVCVSLLFSVNR